MKTINALVTSVGGPIAQGVLKGLEKMGNVRKIGTDRRAVTAGNLFCDTVYTIPSFTNIQEYIQALQEIIEKESIDVLFPAHPNETKFYDLYNKHLEIPVALPRSPFYGSLIDKEAVYEVMKEAELHHLIPRYEGFTENSEILKIKNERFNEEESVIIKQVSAYASFGFAIVTDRRRYLQSLKEGERHVYSFEDYLAVADNRKRIMMERMDRPEYSVDVYVHEGKTVIAVPRRRTGVAAGMVLDGTVENHTFLKEAAASAAEAFITSGFINLQFMKAGEKYKLTDVNPRFCGSQVMSLGAGVNFPEMFIRSTMLNEIVVPEVRWGTRMIRYRESYFVHEQNVEEGEDGLVQKIEYS